MVNKYFHLTPTIEQKNFQRQSTARDICLRV